MNLIPVRRREAKARRGRLRAWAAAMAVYVPAAAVCYALCLSQGDGGHGARLRQMEEASAELGTLARQAKYIRASVTETSAKLAAARAMRMHPDWSVLLALLSGSLGDEVVLDRCVLAGAEPPAASQPSPPDGGTPAAPAPPRPPPGQIGRTNYRLDLRGYARTQRDVSQLILRLEKAGLFDRVRLVKSFRQPFLNGEAVAFQAECFLQPSRGRAP